MMYGQMTAGSWIYIGSQGIVQGTYETFGELANQHFDGDLAGTITLTAGLGGMGGAQPLAVTMNGGVVIGIDVDESRIDKRIETRYCDVKTHSVDEAIRLATEAKDKKEALSIGLVGNAVDIYKELLDKNFKVDIVTDQTSAHDPLNGYVPVEYTFEETVRKRKENPEEVVRLAKKSMAKHVEYMLEYKNVAQLHSIMEIIFVKLHLTKVLQMHSVSQDSYQHTFVRYSAKGKDRFALQH